MRAPLLNCTEDECVYIGIDLQRKRWHVTIRTTQRELFSASILSCIYSSKGSKVCMVLFTMTAWQSPNLP